MKLLAKELRLTLHPSSAVFTFLGCLVIVPAYPFSAIFMFGCLAPYITFVNARETNDFFYTAALPVTKRESVGGKCLLVASLQLFQLLFSVPFVFLRGMLQIPNNPVGIDATLAWYGFGLILYGIFDFVFLTDFYKSGYKVGKAFLVASVPMVLLMAGMEAIPHIPVLSWLDSTQKEYLIGQLKILLLGLACFCICFMLAYRISAKRFEKVNL